MKICSSVPLSDFFEVSCGFGVLEQAVMRQNAVTQRPRATVMRSGAVEIGNTRAIIAGKCSRRLGGLQGFDPIQLTPVELGLSGCGENQFGIPGLRWPASLAPENHTPAGCSKIPDFSPSQPWRPLHPPALSLPRQPLQ